MKGLFAEIERVLPDGGTWCTVDKASTLASIIIGLRPAIVVEIGVWRGGSLVPMLLAMKTIGVGRAIAIDPWAAPASAADQGEVDRKWWSDVDHEAAYQAFLGRLSVLGLEALCTVCRRRSDQCEPPDAIGLLHVDGNHGPQAVRDVERFAPKVTPGGILVLDDLGWTGGHVGRARDLAHTLGFRELYPLGTGVVMQR